jgi:hypothetical protein
VRCQHGRCGLTAGGTPCNRYRRVPLLIALWRYTTAGVVIEGVMAAILSDARSATAERVVHQMGVARGGSRLTMSEYLADETRHGDRAHPRGMTEPRYALI